MTPPITDAELHERFRFELGLAFELCYAMAVVTDPASRIHGRWRAEALARLPAAFAGGFERLGGQPLFWAFVPDSFGEPIMGPSFEAFDEQLHRLPIEDFQRGILLGALHYEESVSRLLDDGATLESVIAAIPEQKQEWLLYLGLYPYSPAKPFVRAIEGLIAEPERCRRTVLEMLETFWRVVFRDTWAQLVEPLEASMREKERLFASSSFAEFADLVRLRVEVDETDGIIRAIRGSYWLRFEDIGRCWVFPSAFNNQRFWHAAATAEGRTDAWFPYFDPTISVGAGPAMLAARDLEPGLDPALIFRALGDTRRFAIAALLANRPMTAVELARRLSLSKATISHHVHILREAGLLDQRPDKGATLLSLRTGTLRSLSALTLKTLGIPEDR